MPSPVADLLTEFRDLFPEFSCVSDGAVTEALNCAMHIFALCDKPIVYLAAHILTVDADAGIGTVGGTVDGGEGETIAESVGGVSASFKSQADTGDDTYYTSTPYGRRFLVLRKTTPGRAFSVRVY